MNKILSGSRVYGAAFLALVLLLVYMTYAVFTKKFSSYDEVTLESSPGGGTTVFVRLPLADPAEDRPATDAGVPRPQRPDADGGAER